MSTNIKKSELVALIAGKADTSKAQAESVLNAFLSVVTDELISGRNVALIGFGTFKVTKRQARKGRNPKTGEVINIAASNSVGFKVGAALKDSVNKKKK